ncbi:Fusarisetin A cluster transcription factor fsa6 [Fusarium oxysporum f. sp. albedinis]|nr:Fusarisetin A cluster transcription factor fsa6 [Fusarium oxysporum f. sp. albedinis]
MTTKKCCRYVDCKVEGEVEMRGSRISPHLFCFQLWLAGCSRYGIAWRGMASRLSDELFLFLLPLGMAADLLHTDFQYKVGSAPNTIPASDPEASHSTTTTNNNNNNNTARHGTSVRARHIRFASKSENLGCTTFLIRQKRNATGTGTVR